LQTPFLLLLLLKYQLLEVELRCGTWQLMPPPPLLLLLLLHAVAGLRPFAAGVVGQ
jgi:hypothetical protein